MQRILDRGKDYFINRIDYKHPLLLIVLILCTSKVINKITTNSSNITIHYSYEKVTVIGELIVISRRPCQTAL